MTVIDASADAKTTVHATYPGYSGATREIVGTGEAFSYGEGKAECAPAWACADRTEVHTLKVSTTANAPIRFRVSGSF